MPANDTLLVSQCVKSDADPTFDQALDCSQATYQTFLTGPDGSGSGTFRLFGGDEPNDQPWGCGHLSTIQPAPSTCYVRFSIGTITDTANDRFFSVSFGPPHRERSSLTHVALGAGAAAVVVVPTGGLLVRSRRRRATR